MKAGNTATLFYVAAALFCAAAALGFINGNSTMAITFLCLGSANLCLGTVKKREASDESAEKGDERDKGAERADNKDKKE